ncbi:interleukin-20 receptor subunit alpha [Notolabrus celidotus]|uniref:interleukin-20 receptor subunit alpha n=1 Tax=Notolabrus celidotus TaxID=1203425 RepID=UPI0014907226|nr:interleukin-20 receptor subunit alpha [Notolabrus celidotus]
MWIIFLLFNLGALCSTVSSSPPSPVDVAFSSVNLRNLLQWSPGNGTPNDTHYTVQYAIYGQSIVGTRGKRVNWRSVRHCTEIVRCWCDLSNETLDLEEGYYAKVRAVSKRASSKWAWTLRRFEPKSDTIFGPPLVMVDMEDNNAIITIKGPMRYQPNNQTPAVSMASLYNQMTYNMSVHNIRSSLMSHFPVVSSPYKYRLMEYNTKYCFSAKTRFLSMPVNCQPSEWLCITTPPDPVMAQLKWMVVGIVVPTVCMCILVVIGCILYQYLTGKGQKSPYTLNPPSFHTPPLTLVLETPSVVLIKVGLPPEFMSIVSDSAYPKKQHIVEPPPRYTSQGLETPQEFMEPSDDLSLDYAFVCKASETHTREEGEERERRYDRREDGNNRRSHCAGAFNPQAKSYPSQKSISTCSEALMPTLTQKEVSTQAHTCLPVNSVFLNQSQAPSFTLQGAAERDRKGEKEKEFSGLFICKVPQTSLFNSPLNVKSEAEEGIEEEMVSGNERAPLLSFYASQSTSQSDQSNDLPDDYGILRPAEAHKIEEEVEKDEEEGGSICINWDPKTGKLVLPEMGMAFMKEDDLMQGEKGRENQIGEEEQVDGMKGGLRLENVFVRQGSEEKAEALREMERREGMEWEADDLLSKWDLVVSMDQ